MSRNEMKTCRSLIKRGKYFLPPPNDSSDFKTLFKRMAAAGVGRPVDKDGFPDSHWTPEFLAEAISAIDGNKAGIELRTVQHWFQDNEKGISADNIRWLARIFGCGDPESASEWQTALHASQRRLVAVRRFKRKENNVTEQTFIEREQPSRANNFLQSETASESRDDRAAIRNVFNLARMCETLFASKSALNLPAAVWAGWVALGFLAYIMDVHNVTYDPKDGLSKQVGFLWAPNWSVLELIILPLFLVIVVQVLDYWKTRGRRTILFETAPGEEIGDWGHTVEMFSYSHWLNLFVCLGMVFVLQWTGVHLRALTLNDASGLAIDWNVMAILRPEVISVPEAIILSMLAFCYTAFICFLFLTGLILLYTVAFDFSQVQRRAKSVGSQGAKADFDVACELMAGVFRCSVLGILIATCIKLQAVYLLTDAQNILSWLKLDALQALGLSAEKNDWLDQRALAHFTSFLLLFTTCSVFLISLTMIYRAVERRNLVPNLGVLELDQTPDRSRYHGWWRMLSVVIILVFNFFAIGQFSGFSFVLVIALILSIVALCDPILGWRQDFEKKPKTRRFKV